MSQKLYALYIKAIIATSHLAAQNNHGCHLPIRMKEWSLVSTLASYSSKHTSYSKFVFFPPPPPLHGFLFRIVNFLFKCFLVKKRKGKRKKEKENCRRRRCDSRERKSLSRCRRQVLLNWNTNDSSNCILLHLTPRPPPHGSSRAHNTSTASTRSLYIQCLRHIAFHIPTHPSFSSTHYSATLMGSQSKVFLSVDWTLTSPPSPYIRIYP